MTGEVFPMIQYIERLTENATTPDANMKHWKHPGQYINIDNASYLFKVIILRYENDYVLTKSFAVHVWLNKPFGPDKGPQNGIMMKRKDADKGAW